MVGEFCLMCLGTQMHQDKPGLGAERQGLVNPLPVGAKGEPACTCMPILP